MYFAGLFETIDTFYETQIHKLLLLITVAILFLKEQCIIWIKKKGTENVSAFI